MLTELRSHIQSPLVFGRSSADRRAFFFWGGPGYYSSRSFQAAWDLGHILYFLLLTCWLHQWFRARKERLLPLSNFFLFFSWLSSSVLRWNSCKCSGGIDLGMEDVLRNQLGCLIAYAFVIRPLAWANLRQRRLMQIGVSLALVALSGRCSGL